VGGGLKTGDGVEESEVRSARDEGRQVDERERFRRKRQWGGDPTGVTGV